MSDTTNKLACSSSTLSVS